MNQPSILIIDDNEDLAYGLGIILEEENFLVTLAHSGSDGIKEFNKKKFDVVLLDVKLPDKNGIEVFQQIHKKDPDVRLIMMTGYRVEQFIAEVIDDGDVEVLRKPFELERVSEILTSINNESIVLIADDDPDLPTNLSAYLADQGMMIKHAHTAKEAIEYVSINPVDVLVLDLRLPIMCGLEIYLELKQYDRSVKTIIITGGQATEAIDTLNLLQSTAVTGCLFKPFKPEAMIQAIEQVMKH